MPEENKSGVRDRSVPSIPNPNNKKRIIKFFLIGISILAPILIGAFLFFKISHGDKNDVVSFLLGNSRNEKKAEFKEILPPENGTWSDYLDPNLSVGCSGTLGNNPLTTISNFPHEDEFSQETGVSPGVGSSGSVLTVVDPIKNIMYLTVNTPNPDGELGYIQFRDDEDHNKPPIFEKKTYSKETKFQLSFNDQVKKEIFNDKLFIEYYSKYLSLRGFAYGNSGDAGHLDHLSRCLTTMKVPTIKILSPLAGEQLVTGGTLQLRWEIVYPPGQDINKYHLATTIYIFNDQGQSVGAVTYDGTAKEGENEFSWFINKRLPLASQNNKYTFQFMIYDHDQVASPSVRYNVASVNGVIIGDAPVVTSQNTIDNQ